MVRVLSLNATDGGTALHRPLLARIDELAPDLLTLQEVRAHTVGLWRTTLEAAGYRLANTFGLARQHGLPHPGPFREDGLLIASRWPIHEPARADDAERPREHRRHVVAIGIQPPVGQRRRARPGRGGGRVDDEEVGVRGRPASARLAPHPTKPAPTGAPLLLVLDVSQRTPLCGIRQDVAGGRPSARRIRNGTAGEPSNGGPERPVRHPQTRVQEAHVPQDG